MIDERAAREFLACGRVAVVGASADHRQFGNVVFQALRDHGIEAVAVHPSAARTGAAEGGQPAYPDLASVPGEVDGVVVMVKADDAAPVIRACAARGIHRVWLFKGLGGPGAVSGEVLDLCRHYGIDAVPGACPLMFLEPVGLAHRIHRSARRANHSLSKAPQRA
jgi:predicted CoA-binding protein